MIDDRQLETLVATAAALGVDSMRAPLFAIRAARASARLDGRGAASDEDLALAARLVLGPRATRLPSEPDAPAPAEAPPPEGGPSRDAEPLEDRVLDAARATVPADLLAAIAEGRATRHAPPSHGTGARRRSGARGRPQGARAGLPRGGARLALIDTLRAAAPWQAIRRAEDGSSRLHIRKADIRVRRFTARAEAVTIFAVDASGSSAAARLAEAKGAVELLLARAYIARAQVALLAFRGSTAELLLPPTRSLTRARRALAGLPGGGGTPLAAGLDAACALADAVRARGRTPFLVVLTDGGANVAADGTAGRKQAAADAEAAARRIAAAGFAGAVIDISFRPQPAAESIARAMAARYVALPRADAAAVHDAVSALQR